MFNAYKVTCYWTKVCVVTLGGSVAQWLACSPCAQENVGSNPAPAASENVSMIGIMCQCSRAGEQNRSKMGAI